MKRLLIVVDFQRDFVDGSLGFEKAQELDQRIASKIKEYKNNKDQVIFTFDTHYEDYLNTIEGKYLPIKHCIKETLGHDLYGEVSKLKDDEDLCFEKNTFPSLDLANYLVDKKYKSVELCGLVSNICVLSNVVMVKSALPNIEIYVDKRLTKSFDDDLNDACFKILKGLHVNVVE